MSTTLLNDHRAFLPSTGRGRLAEPGRYLNFLLGGDLFGLPVLRVREIIRLVRQLTRIPQMPDYVKGCLNLRGAVIPVVDLREKFRIAPGGDDHLNCIVVTEVHLDSDSLLMGLIVDAVQEVVNIRQPDMEPAPEFGGGIDTAFILGMAKVKKDLVALLNIDKVVAFPTLKAMKEGVSAMAPGQTVSFQDVKK